MKKDIAAHVRSKEVNEWKNHLLIDPLMSSIDASRLWIRR